MVNLTLSPQIAEHVAVHGGVSSGPFGAGSETDLDFYDTVEVVLNTTQAALLLKDLSSQLADALAEEHDDA